TICHPCVRAGHARAGGEGGIRTHERVSPLAVFKTAALNHSATSPDGLPLRKGHTLCKLCRTPAIRLRKASKFQCDVYHWGTAWIGQSDDRGYLNQSGVGDDPRPQPVSRFVRGSLQAEGVVRG